MRGDRMIKGKKKVVKKSVPARKARRAPAAPKKKPFRLEVGKYYKSRRGRNIGPMEKDSGLPEWPFCAKNSGFTYRLDGTQDFLKGMKSSEDLVREVKGRGK